MRSKEHGEVPMTLVEAFRRYGPGEEAAGELLLEAIHEVARRVAPGFQDREDLVQTVMLRLVVVGPRGFRNGDPETDEQVKGVLGKAVKNGLIDDGRRDPPEPLPHGELAGSTSLVDLLPEETEQLFWRLFSEYALKAGKGVALRTLEDVCEISRSQPKRRPEVKAQLLDRAGISQDGWRQRELRAREVLFTWLDSVECSARMSGFDLERVRVVVHELFLRPDRDHARLGTTDGERR